MDGTLTLAVHDFEVIREQLGLPPGEAILEQLDRMTPAKRRPIDIRLREIELGFARESTAAPGAHELLATLRTRGPIGILTRNTRENAMTTLQAAGLNDYFAPENVLGRDEAPPKPDPAGIHLLLERWGHPPGDAVFVGDYVFDLEAGRAAGAATIYRDPTREFPFAHLADLCVGELSELMQGD